VVDVEPTPSFIESLLGCIRREKSGVYIHVKTTDKLFYADVHQFSEILKKATHEIKPETYEKKHIKREQLNLDIYGLTDRGILHIMEKTGHQFPTFLDDKTYEVFKAVKEFMEWLREDASTDTYQYSFTKLGPVIADFRKAVHIGSIMKIVAPFIPGLPADFSVTKYVDHENTSEVSLNSDMHALCQLLDKKIKRYDAMHDEPKAEEKKEVQEQKEKRKDETAEEYPSVLLFKKKDDETKEQKGPQNKFFASA
jgi:hypothetical protein